MATKKKIAKKTKKSPKYSVKVVIPSNIALKKEKNGWVFWL